MNSLSECFNSIRQSYVEIEEMKSRFCEDMERGDPYAVDEVWMTPIERLIWCDLRTYFNVTFWPQYPVGKYFVDFAAVTAKVAIECDGVAYHDAKKDAERDENLKAMGWQVFRISGRNCHDEEASKKFLSIVADAVSAKLGRKCAPALQEFKGHEDEDLQEW